MRIVVLVAYSWLQLCSIAGQREVPRAPIKRTRHHCKGCVIEHAPFQTCDFGYNRQCSEKAGCLRKDGRCLEMPANEPQNHIRCCCLPENGVTGHSSCEVVDFWYVPPLYHQCVVDCCQHRPCGVGCAEEGEGCGDALPPYSGKCYVMLNATASEQTQKNCCLWKGGVDCLSELGENCCMEAQVQPGQRCQAPPGDCLAKRSTTLPPTTQLSNDVSAVVALAAVFLTLAAGSVACLVVRRRQDCPQQREHLLVPQAGPCMPLEDLPPCSMRAALIVSCSSFTGGFEPIQDAHEQGERLKTTFQELSFNKVKHERCRPPRSSGRCWRASCGNWTGNPTCCLFYTSSPMVLKLRATPLRQ